MRILLVEDDAETAALIIQGIGNTGYDITIATNGKDGLHAAMQDAWDVLIIDRLLPELDGLALVSTLRRNGMEVPVLFLTALGGIDDRVCGFNVGCDDYLVKPFAFPELMARINALYKRPRLRQETRLQVGDLRIDVLERRVFRAEREIELFPQEFRLLEYFMRNAGKVVTRTMLLENVWKLNIDPHTNIVESHLSRLRSKLDGGMELISTIRGSGYRFNVYP